MNFFGRNRRRRAEQRCQLLPAHWRSLRRLEDAGYVTSETTGNGRASRTSIALTAAGRAALDTYTNALRQLLDGL